MTVQPLPTRVVLAAFCSSCVILVESIPIVIYPTFTVLMSLTISYKDSLSSLQWWNIMSPLVSAP